MTLSLCGTALMARFGASSSVSSVFQHIIELSASVSGIAVWTYFAHVACVSSRTHLTFNDRHLSQDMVLDWLFLGAILEIHLADHYNCVSTRCSVKATT
jgi:LytS/YehU family sensor histidine kinase